LLLHALCSCPRVLSLKHLGPAPALRTPHRYRPHNNSSNHPSGSTARSHSNNNTLLTGVWLSSCRIPISGLRWPGPPALKRRHRDMSLPQRPDGSARREERHRRRRTSDAESRRSHDRTHSHSKSGAYSHAQPLPSPGTGPVPMERDPIMRGQQSTPTQELGRKRSLIRPERRRLDPSDPDYHYRKHAQQRPYPGRCYGG
jgi:hypothetical protein